NRAPGPDARSSHGNPGQRTWNWEQGTGNREQLALAIGRFAIGRSASGWHNSLKAMSSLSRLVFASALAGLVVTISLHAQTPGRGRGQAPQLPDGAGRELVQSICIACHQLNMITGAAGYDQKGWRALVTTMVALPEPQLNTITTYLATSFPEKPGRKPKLIAGDTTVAIKEWIAPTLGQRPRDPLQTADGTIWWAGMFASVIGRLNPS